jgi:hypothetical protein
MKKLIIALLIISVMLLQTATAFVPFSNDTYTTQHGAKYQSYIPAFGVTQLVFKNESLANRRLEGGESFGDNTKIELPYTVLDPDTQRMMDNNTLFAIVIVYDPLNNALPPCSADFSDTLNDVVWIVGDVTPDPNYLFYDLNSTNWAQDKSATFYFEADRYSSVYNRYEDEINLLLTKETFCPTIKIYSFRKLSWTEAIITAEENRAETIHTTATNIFGYAIQIIQLNYKLWLIAYWVIMILVLLGAVSLVFFIPWLIYKHVKRL